MTRRSNSSEGSRETGSRAFEERFIAKSMLGWREWVQLPEIETGFMEAKIDTGARSSSLDAIPLEEFQRNKQRWLRFSIFSVADLSMMGKTVESRLLGFRDVRSSTGHLTHRPVIETTIRIGDFCWPIELTLTNRQSMGFRLLLGRSAIENRFCVDVSRSYLGNAQPE